MASSGKEPGFLSLRETEQPAGQLTGKTIKDISLPIVTGFIYYERLLSVILLKFIMCGSHQTGSTGMLISMCSVAPTEHIDVEYFYFAKTQVKENELDGFYILPTGMEVFI